MRAKQSYTHLSVTEAYVKLSKKARWQKTSVTADS